MSEIHPALPSGIARLLAFFSTLAGSVVATSWFFHLQLLSGSGSAAAAVVLGGLAAGVAAGTALGTAPPGAGPELRRYGILQAWSGAWTLLTPFLFGLGAPAFGVTDWGPASAALRCLAALGWLVALLPSTLSLGAALASLPAARGAWPGALAGLLLGGGLLPEALGVATTLRLAASLALVVGLACLGRAPGPDAAGDRALLFRDPSRPLQSFVEGLRLWVGRGAGPFWSGAALGTGLVGWTRFGEALLGPAYGFPAVLALALGGAGLGFRLGVRPGPGPAPATLLALGTGLLAAATCPVLAALPQLLPDLFAPAGPLSALATSLSALALVMVGPAALAGLWLRLAGPSFWGPAALGGGAGATLAGLVLIPAAGGRTTVALAALLLLALAARSAAVSLPRGRWALGALAVGALLTFPWASPGWLYRRDGERTVGVRLLPGRRLSLEIDGRPVASSSRGDLLAGRLSVYLPLLASGRSPDRALLVGLSNGVALDVLRGLPGISAVDCLEPDPGVRSAVHWWASHNGGVAADPRVRLLDVCPRAFLSGSAPTYGLILVAPSDPLGQASLYSREFFARCAQHLAPQGLVAVSLSLARAPPARMASIARAFFELFPEGSLWLSARGEALLVGSYAPLWPSSMTFRQAWSSLPGLARQMWDLDIQLPEELMARFVIPRERGVRMGSSPATEDGPGLAAAAPQALYGLSQTAPSMALLESLRGSWPEPWMEQMPKGRALGAAGLADVGSVELAREILGPIPLSPQGGYVAAGPTSLTEARMLVWEGASDAQIREGFLRCVTEGADAARTAVCWARFERSRGRWRAALRLFQQALREEALPPGCEGEVYQGIGQCQMELGNLEEALAALRQASSYDARALPLLGEALRRSGRLEEAREAFARAAQDPVEVDARVGLGRVLAAQGKAEEAARAFRQALVLEPGNLPALLGLAACQQVLGDRRGAAATYRRVLALDPGNPQARQALGP